MLVSDTRTKSVLQIGTARNDCSGELTIQKLLKQIQHISEIYLSPGYIYKPLMCEFINRVKVNIADIVSQSRKNPYRHSVLTYSIEALIYRLKLIDTNSPKRKLIQEEMERIYSAMLNICSVSTTKLSMLMPPEIWDLIFLFLTKRRGGRSGGNVRDDILKNIYYAYTQNEIRTRVLQKFINKLEITPIEERHIDIIQINILNKNIALAKTINACAIEDHECPMELFPHLTFFSDKMCGKDIKIKDAITRCTNLQHIKLADISLLVDFPCPEKIIRLDLRDLQNSNLADNEIMNKYENIEILKEKSSLWRFLPYPEKFKKLNLGNSSICIDDAFMKRCLTLESLCIYTKTEIDLSHLPNLSLLKKLDVMGSSYTPNILEKLLNLEKLSLRIDHNPKEHLEPLKKQWLNLLPRLHSLKVILKPGQDFDDILLQCLPCENVKRLECWTFASLTMDTTDLILKCFPNLRLLKFRYHFDMSIIDYLKDKGVAIESL